MIKTITFTFISILLFSCSWETEENISRNDFIQTEKIKNVKPKINSKKECQCYNGIGASEKDNPLFVFDFSNGKSISICGFKDSELQTDFLNISEFNVFDCVSGKSYAEYGAMENCIIKTKQDTLIIQLLKFLPTGKDWKWISVQIAEQIITIDLNEIEVSKIKAKYKPIFINSNIQADFLSSLDRGKGFGENWEDDLGRLEVLSLLGNEKAWEILKNYEIFTGEQTDGALAEQWKDAISTVEWITGVE